MYLKINWHIASALQDVSHSMILNPAIVTVELTSALADFFLSQDNKTK